MISVENVTFTYPGAPPPTLTNVSFEVSERSLLVVLGPNGVGKTTLLRTMIGLQKWDSGCILTDGTPISSVSTRVLSRVLSYVPQARNASNAVLTGPEVVMVGRAPHMRTLAQPGAREERMTRDVLDEVGAPHLAEMPYATMPSGQSQMILIACVLVAGPRVLVLDEPETGLGFRSQLIVPGLLECLARDRDFAVIMNTHYPAHTLRIVDQVALFSSTHEAVVGSASSVMNADTLVSIFGVDAVIGSIAFKGEDVQAIVPVRLSGDKWCRHTKNYFVTIVQVSHIFIASAVPYDCDPACPIRGHRCRAGTTGLRRFRRRDRAVSQRWGEYEGGLTATGTIKQLNNAKGFGFITPDDESGDASMHYSNIIGQSGHRTLLEGEEAERETIEGPKGLQAMNVARVE